MVVILFYCLKLDAFMAFGFLLVFVFFLMIFKFPKCSQDLGLYAFYYIFEMEIEEMSWFEIGLAVPL